MGGVVVGVMVVVEVVVVVVVVAVLTATSVCVTWYGPVAGLLRGVGCRRIAGRPDWRIAGPPGFPLLVARILIQVSRLVWMVLSFSCTSVCVT